MSLRIECVTIDTHDPAGIAGFWAEVLGWQQTSEDGEEVAVEPPPGSPADGVSPGLLFIRVPEDKSVKNRIHLDLRPADQVAEVQRLEGLGARRVEIGQGADVTWIVMADPDGNEFCVLRALRPDEKS